MIIVTRENGDVHFLNEKEFFEIKYCEEFRQLVAYPIQRTASIGMPMRNIEITDVETVQFNNDASPASMTIKQSD